MHRVAAALLLVAPEILTPTSAQDGDGCVSDLNEDGTVGVDDMLQLLASYGTSGCTAGNTAGAVIGDSSAGAIYVNSFNQFCSGALPEGSAELREQSKCWICEDVIRAYLNDNSYLPPAGTNFSPTSTSFTLGFDFFVFGYDAAGFYQGTPGWNDGGVANSDGGFWPPGYTGDCNTAYGEDLSECQAAIGGTYAIPAQTCEQLCGNQATCPDTSEGAEAGAVLPDTACRRHYSSHDEQSTGGNTNMYNEKVEHQYELTAMATAGAFFHGYFLDNFGLLGETVYTQPDGAGGFMSCSFTDFPWEIANAGSSAAAEAQATAAASIYISSFNTFCSGALPEGSSAVREQTKCWICEDVVRAYIGDMTYLPPAGVNFSPTDTPFVLGFDFFVFGYDAAGFYQGSPGWNDGAVANSDGGFWPPGDVGDCNTVYGEDLSECQATLGAGAGTYTVPAQNCEEMCGAEVDGIQATCAGGPYNNETLPATACRRHFNSHDEQATGGGTNMYAEKVEHQYELTAKATAGAFFHGYYLDSIGLSGETVYTQPDGNGGFMSCSFTDYAWESVSDTAATLAAMQVSLDTLVAAADAGR
jgi:hypothetical protein